MEISLVNIIYTAIVISVPLILAALGGMISVRAGIMALGLEGMMLAGAFGASVGTYYTGNAFVGLFVAILTGGFFGLMHGILCIRFKVNQIISGIGLNLLSIAGTTLFLSIIWGSRGTSGSIGKLPHVKIGWLESIPILGELYGQQSMLFYAMVFFVIVMWIFLFKTVAGLRMRMVGEHPKAAATLGVNVNRYKYSAVILCGFLAGMAGAYLSIDYLDSFIRGISAGRGYIAVVINILGGFSPVGVIIAGTIFGFAEAIQIALQGGNIPTQFIQMIPYAVTLVVLVVGSKYVSGPQGIGENVDD